MRPRELFLWSVLVVLAGVLIWLASNRTVSTERVLSAADFMKQVNSGVVARVTVTDQQVIATTRTNQTFATEKPSDADSLIRDLVTRRINVTFAPRSDRSPVILALGFYTSTILPWFTFALVLVAFGRVRAIEKRIEALTDRGVGPEPPAS